jgi:hypothetical protein
MHLNNCFEVFSTGDSLEERFNTCRVPIAIDGDKAKELEECITDMNDALDHLDKCKFLVDSGIGALQEFVHKV